MHECWQQTRSYKYGLSTNTVLQAVRSYNQYGLTSIMVLQPIWSYIHHGRTANMALQPIRPYNQYGLVGIRFHSQYCLTAYTGLPPTQFIMALQPTWPYNQYGLTGIRCNSQHLPIANKVSHPIHFNNHYGLTANMALQPIWSYNHTVPLPIWSYNSREVPFYHVERAALRLK